MKTKRFLATLLCLLMMASLFPTSALADGGPDPAGLMDAAGETGTGTDEEPANEAAEEPATEPDAEPMAEPARSLRSTDMTVFAAAASCTVKLYLDPGPEAGTVSVSPASGWTVGQKITLTATAYSGYTFMWWVNCATGENSTSSTYTTTLTGDCEWVAVFRKNGEYFIYISKPWVENDPSQTLQVSPDASSYASGTQITLNAPAKSGRSVVYEYGRYVDGQSSSLTSWTRIGGNSFSMPSYDTLVRGLYSVNLTLSTGAHGTATLSPSSGPYYEDDVVTLTVNPDSGYRALTYGIPADYTVSGDTYTFTVGERDLTISVEFEALPAISLDVGAYPDDAAGSVSISKNETYISQNETYGEVTLTATPKGGYHFLGWYDMGSSSFISEANPFTFEPTQSMTIFAYFYVSVYKANVEHGTLEIVDEQQVYKAGDVVTLKGTPDEGYVLDYYLAGKLEGSSANLESLEGDSFTMPAYDMAVGVKFAKLHTISALASPNEGGTVTGAGQYKDGTVVTLTATANSGYRFVNWTENGAEVSADSTCSFTASANRTLVANFELIPATKYTIGVSASPTEGGTVTGAGEYESGATITLTVTANSGYHFVNWTENGAEVSADTAYTFTADRDRTLIANFHDDSAVISYPLWVGGEQVTSLNKGDILNDGTASYDPDSSTLTLTNANITGVYGNANIRVDSMDLTISLTGSNSLSGSPYAIRVDGDLTIAGGGSLTTSGVGHNIYITGGNLIIDGCVISATSTGPYAISVFDGDLTIKDSSVTATADGYYGLSCGGALTIRGDSRLSAQAANCAVSPGNGFAIGEGLSITTPTGGYVVGNSIKDSDGNTAKSVVIELQRYPLFVGGVQVTSFNEDDVLGDGTVRFEGDASGGTLTLNNASILSQGGLTAGIRFGDAEGAMDLILRGSGVIGSTETNVGLFGIGAAELNGDFTIHGKVHGAFVTDLKLTGGTISFTGDGTYGAVYTGDFLMTGGNVTVSGPRGGVETSIIEEVQATISGGTLIVDGGAGNGLTGNSILISGGTVKVTSGQVAIDSLTGVTFSGGSVEAMCTGTGVGARAIFGKNVTVENGIDRLLASGAYGALVPIYDTEIGDQLVYRQGSVPGDPLVELIHPYYVEQESGSEFGRVEPLGMVAAGDEVRAIPDDGYEIESMSYTPEGGDTVRVPGDSFEMPAANVSVTFRIKSIDISKAAVSAIPDQEYTGGELTPKPTTVTWNGKTLAEGRDYTLAYKDNHDAGTATVTMTGCGNFTGTKTVPFTITPKALTIIAEAKSKTYGEADPALIYTADGLVGSDTITGELTRAAGENVGRYAITQGTLTAGDNYAITFTGAELTIGAKALTITAETKSKTYGEADPALTYTADGLVGSDTITGELTRADGENVGSYAITQGTLTAGDNYAITFTGAELTIGAKALTITAEAKSKTYGEADPALIYTADGLVGSDTITGELTRVAGENVGSYAITQGTLTAGDNYAITFTGAELTIEKAAITITADDKSSKYGEDIADLTYQIGGEYKTGDDLGVTVTTTATRTSDAGEYPITVSWKENPNYSATLVNGKYTIIKTDLAVSAAGYSGVYDKSAHGITVDVGSSDAAVYYAETELTSDNYSTAGSTTNPTYTDAGEYTVYFYVVSGNYVPDTVSGSKTVVIIAASGTADETQGETPTARTGLAYTGEPQVLVTAPTKLPEGYDKVQYSLDGGTTWTDSLPTGTDAGDYTVSVRYLGDKNHEDFSIASIPVTIKATWTVKYEMGGAEAIDDQTVVDGEKPAKPADPAWDGYSFDGWYADGDFKTVFDFSAAITADTTVYAKWTAIGYAVTAITGTTADSSHTWRKGSTTPVVITVKPVAGEDHSFAHFVGVDLDGRTLVLEADYTAHEGSTVVTLKPAMLEKISLGDHTVTILFDNGKVDVRLTIKAAPTSPATGDDRVTGLWAVLTILSAMGMGGVTVFVKKRRYSGKH